jgi:hypothetical protein
VLDPIPHVVLGAEAGTISVEVRASLWNTHAQRGERLRAAHGGLATLDLRGVADVKSALLRFCVSNITSLDGLIERWRRAGESDANLTLLRELRAAFTAIHTNASKFP